MKALARRIAILETKLNASKPASNIDAEIRAMTPSEQNRLREYLLFLKNGGQPEGAEYQILRLAAEEAILSARQRIQDAEHIADLTLSSLIKVSQRVMLFWSLKNIRDR